MSVFVAIVAFVVLLVVVTNAKSSIERKLDGMREDTHSVAQRLVEIIDDMRVLSVKVDDLRVERTSVKPTVGRATTPPQEQEERVTSAAVRSAEQRPPQAAQAAPESGPQAQPELQPVATSAEPVFAAVEAATVQSSPTASARPPAPPPKVVEDVKAALRRMWSWILVGRESRPSNVSMESAVASTWLMRGGMLLLLVAVFIFLKLVHGALGEVGRVVLIVGVGLVMTVVGVRLLRSRYRLLGEGFVGVGLAALYASMFAAGPKYGLLDTPVVFALMVLITLAAGFLAVRTNSQLIAIFGLIGGYGTPLMLSTGQPQFVVLYSYLLLLGIGVLGVSHVKQWRLLNYLAFIVTWCVFWLSLSLYDQARDFTVAITFISLLFVQHSAIVYYYNVARGKRAGLLEVIHLLLNVGFFAATSYYLIADACGRPWPAVMAVAVAAFYVVHVFLFLRRGVADRTLLTAFMGVAGFFTVWAMPLIFEKETLTIFWALQALLFLWLGLKLNSSLLGMLAQVMYAIVGFRAVVWDLPRDFVNLDWSSRPFGDYWHGFLDRLWTFGVVIVTFFAAFFVQGRGVARSAAFSVAQGSDVGAPADSWTRGVRELLYWCGVALLFTVMYLESAGLLSYWTPVRVPMLTALWAGLAVFLLHRFRRTRHAWIFAAASIVLAVAVVKIIFWDLDEWGFHIFRLGARWEPMQALMRLLDFGFLVAVFAVFQRWVSVDGVQPAMRRLFRVTGIALLFMYTTLETGAFFERFLDGFRSGAVSVLWSVFAIVFLVRGLRTSSKGYRYSGLVLFGIVAVKVFTVDLAYMHLIYRVFGAMLVGGLLIAGSYLYLSSERPSAAKESVR